MTHILVDEADADLLALGWSVGKRGYAAKSSASPKTLHRHIMQRILGRPLVTAELVDHVDRNRLNNRRSNLRMADRRTNTYNKPPQESTSSRYKGIYRHKRAGKWMAKVTVDRTQIYLGLYVDETEAAYIYDQFAAELFGEYAYLNLL